MKLKQMIISLCSILTTSLSVSITNASEIFKVFIKKNDVKSFSNFDVEYINNLINSKNCNFKIHDEGVELFVNAESEDGDDFLKKLKEKGFVVKPRYSSESVDCTDPCQTTHF